MKIELIKRLAFAGLLLIISAVSLTAQKSAADSEAEIRQVIENFRLAIIKKDKPLLLSLFSEGVIGWQSVLDNKSLERVRTKDTKAAKVDTKDSHIAFEDFISSDPKRTEETFANIKISTDGEAASVGFDYVFLYDNRENNRGKEFWLLVRSENGWKITSVVWSQTLPPAELK